MLKFKKRENLQNVLKQKNMYFYKEKKHEIYSLGSVMFQTILYLFIKQTPIYFHTNVEWTGPQLIFFCFVFSTKGYRNRQKWIWQLMFSCIVISFYVWIVLKVVELFPFNFILKFNSFITSFFFRSEIIVRLWKYLKVNREGTF